MSADLVGARAAVPLVATACLALALAAPTGLLSRRAAAQTIRGYAQVQYELQDRRVSVERDLEWWNRTVHLDYGTRVAQKLDITAQGEWNDLSYVGRPDRQINPRGALRFAHREFGGHFSYRPLRVTDALGVTTRQRETTFNGYLNRAGWPRLNASYVRRRQLALGLLPEATGIRRSITANHQLGAFRLRGSWGHTTRGSELAGQSRTSQVDWGGGGEWALARPGGSARIGYETQLSRRKGDTGAVEHADVHTLNANGTRRLHRRLDASTTYSFRYTDVGNGLSDAIRDHEGVAFLRYRATGAVTATAGAGVRTARIETRRATERYALVTLAAQGRVRAGWTGSAGLTRSLNWLPGESSRLIDAASITSRMRLTRGLDAMAQTQVTSGRAPSSVADTSGQRVRVTAQTSLGLSATPLMPITVRYSWSEYRTGGDLFAPDATSRADSWDARWSPQRSLQFTGALSRARGLSAGEAPTTTTQATAQWTPHASFQLSGSYLRGSSGRLDPITQSLIGREAYGLRLLAAPMRDWRIQASLNAIDPGRASHVRQWDLSLTRNLRR